MKTYFVCLLVCMSSVGCGISLEKSSRRPVDQEQVLPEEVAGNQSAPCRDVLYFTYLYERKHLLALVQDPSPTSSVTINGEEMENGRGSSCRSDYSMVKSMQTPIETLDVILNFTDKPSEERHLVLPSALSVIAPKSDDQVDIQNGFTIQIDGDLAADEFAQCHVNIPIKDADGKKRHISARAINVVDGKCSMEPADLRDEGEVDPAEKISFFVANRRYVERNGRRNGIFLNVQTDDISLNIGR